MTDPTTTDLAVPAIEKLTSIGAALAEPTSLEMEDAPDLMVGMVPDGWTLETLDLSDYDGLRAAPRRVRGTATVTDTASWLAYFGKHKQATSEVFGDVRQNTITALLNAPGALNPAWGDHRVALKLQPSAAWQAWTGKNGKLLSQSDFAEHVEDRTPDFVTPDAASMLEIAQSVQATTGVKFESSIRLADGQRRLQYLEQVESKAGQRGNLDVPTEFEIRLQVWRGVAIVVPLTARLRIRIAPQGLLLTYVLDRLEDVLDAAWDALLEELREAIDVPILSGQAPSYDA